MTFFKNTTLRKCLVALALLLGVQGSAKAGTILYFADFTVGADRMSAALAGLAGTHTTTVASDLLDFTTQISGGGYDMGILAVQGSYSTDHANAIAALGAHVTGGGLGIVCDWFISAPADLIPFEATFTGNFNESTVTVTEPAFTPGLTNPFTLTNTGWGIFSTGLAPLAGGSSAADFPSGEDAIIVGNSGRSIVNGFLNDTVTTEADGVALYTNEINFLFGGAAAVPEPGTLTLCGMGLLGLGGYALRRRKAARA